MTRTENVWQDVNHGGWIAEIQDIDYKWFLIGVFGTREAALDAVRKTR